MKKLKNKRNTILSNLLVLLGGTIMYENAFADTYCKSSEPSYVIPINQIDIRPDAKVGDIVGRSDQITKEITCSEDIPYVLVAHALTVNEPTGVFIKEHGVNCEAIPSGYPGIGIAWFNHNTKTGVWMCGSNSNGLGFLARGLPESANENWRSVIKDEIFLVKTGPVAPGSHFFNKEFGFNEAKDTLRLNGTYDYLPQFGKLYSIFLQGQIDINAPKCKVNKNAYTEKFKTKDALSLAHETNDITLNVSCDGYIENGTVVNFDVVSPNGQMPSDKNYFATEMKEVGMAVKYKNLSNNFVNLDVQGSKQIPVVINNNASDIHLKLIPYIKNGSGEYPVDLDKVKFKLNLVTGDN